MHIYLARFESADGDTRSEAAPTLEDLARRIPPKASMYAVRDDKSPRLSIIQYEWIDGVLASHDDITVNEIWNITYFGLKEAKDAIERVLAITFYEISPSHSPDADVSDEAYDAAKSLCLDALLGRGYFSPTPSRMSKIVLIKALRQTFVQYTTLKFAE